MNTKSIGFSIKKIGIGKSFVQILGFITEYLILPTMRSQSACLRGNNMIDLKREAYYQATVVK